MDELLGKHFISLFLILLFGIRLSSQRSTRDKGLRYFWLAVVSCFLLILQDYAEVYTSKNPDLIFWRTLLSVAGYFLRSVASASLVLAAVKPEKRNFFVWVPCLIVLLVCSTAFFTDLAFGFDEEYRFYRGPLGFVPFVVPISYLVAILWETYKRYGDSGKTDHLILGACAVFCLLSALLDSLRGGVRLHEAILISSIFFYVFLRSYDVRRDSLTMLLNRQSMYDDCEALKKSISAAASLDMNGLKKLNDSHGHHAGDKALHRVGECILAVTNRRIRGYRIGGDEFVILFVGAEESEVRETLDQVRESVEESGLSLACGYVMRDGEDEPEQMILRSDLKMFENKARHYMQQGHDRRRRSTFRSLSSPGDLGTGIADLPEPVAVYQFGDHSVKSLAVSAGFRDMFGYSKIEEPLDVLDPVLLSGVHGDDMERFSGAMLRFSEGNEELDVVYRISAGMPSGFRVVHARGKHTHAGDGSTIAYIWFMDEGGYSEEDAEGASPVSQALNRALHEESILYAARYDDLTGLPNLTWFFQLYEAGKDRILGQGGQAALLYMDLSGMKYYNHRNGFAEGDRLLKAFAGTLVRIFGRENCCHINADRFAAVAQENQAENLIHQLFAEAAGMNEGRTLPVLVGVYGTSFESVPVSSAYDRAKMACDAIRRTSASAFRYYSADLRDSARKRQYVVTNIDRAVAEGWIQVYYQPIVRSANEKVCDEEALARWVDPAVGLLSPADFVPPLEESGLIYKLDLCVLDQVLEKIRITREAGMNIVPHSINLSRADFDACDIVEEIRRRVDEAGVSRDRITIEITESIIGSDFDFMKGQIARFRELGFSIWMDDFGSGYSSLDVMQSLPFDLIKFDMSFLRRLDEGEGGRIILTEMVKLATSLHLDTICEGVETEDHVHFLQEIGCAKLQGFYFCPPIPLEKIMERYREGRQIGFEDIRASSYFETIARVNLYDPGLIAGTDEQSFQHAFSTLPMAVMEIRDQTARYVRSNPSYRHFMKNFFHFDINDMTRDFTPFDEPFMDSVVQNCCRQDTRSFFDEKLGNGSVVHSFARRICVNPSSGDTAVVVAVLSVSDPDSGKSEKESGPLSPGEAGS